MHHRTVILGASAHVLAASLMMGSAASAQTSPSVSREGEGFGDIIVTARKRDERLQDVPVAITAFSANDLNRYATQSIQDVATQTPQLMLGTVAASTGGVINLRGVGSPATGPTIEQAVSINLDGIQVSNAAAIRLGLHDLDRIEILKGPQTLFYGKNSPGGIISIISADPSDKLEGKVRGGYEFTTQRKFVEAGISSPLTDALALRITGFFSDEDGWFRNNARPLPPVPIPASLGGAPGDITAPGPGTTVRDSPRREYFVRGTLVYSPDDSFKATLKASWGKEHRKHGIQFFNQHVLCGSGDGPAAVLLLGAGNRDCRVDRYTNEPDINPQLASLDPLFKDGKPLYDNRQLLLTGAISWEPTEQLQINSVTGYYKLRDYFITNFAYGDRSDAASASLLKQSQFSQEVRLTTKFDSPFNVMLGGYYQDVNLRNFNPVVLDDFYTDLITGGFLSGPILLVNPLIHQKTKAWSVFGQAIVDITPELQLTAGGRYSREKKSGGVTLLPSVFSPTTSELALDPSSKTFDNFSPDVTLTYKPVSTLTLYGSYKKGFKSGGFDLNALTAPGDASYDQELVEGFEIGAKGSLFDRQVSFDLALYSFKYTGLQVSAFDPNAFGYKVTNAGSARVKGVDFSLQYRPRPIPGLTLRTAVAYNSARYISFRNSPCWTGQSQAAGCNLVTTVDNGNLVIRPVGPGEIANAQDLSGRPFVRAPKWSGNAGFTFEQPLNDAFIVSLSSDVAYTGSYNIVPDLNPGANVRRAWRLNGSLAVSKDERWELALIGTNLTNVLRAIGGTGHLLTGSGTGAPGTGVSGDILGGVTEPRTVTLQVTFKY